MMKGKQRRPSLTPEEILARAFRAKCRFRAIVRLVMQNIYWLDDIEDTKDVVLGDDVRKNVLLLTRRKRQQGLTLLDKSILNKPTEYRTQEEKERLERVIGSLGCFKKYPKELKSKLPEVTFYFYFGPGRTILRQNHEPFGFYFIISGEVAVFQETVDPVFNEKVTNVLGIRGPGSIFGEVALLHNIRRSASVVTKTHCEFLAVKKEDFNLVIKATVAQHWENIKTGMRRFTYFADWDDVAIRECCLISKLNMYSAGETILGDGEGSSLYVYFILQGKCQVIQHLMVIPYLKNGKKFYKLYEPLQAKTSQESQSTQTEDTQSQSSKTEKSKFLATSLLNVGSVDDVKQKSADLVVSNVETRFFQVCNLYPLACFAIGENQEHRRIMAAQQTQCLLIPRYWLIQRNKANVWQQLQHNLDVLTPSTKDVFQAFLRQRKWMAYRKQLVKDLNKRKLPPFNCIANVPFYIRMHEQIDYD